MKHIRIFFVIVLIALLVAACGPAAGAPAATEAPAMEPVTLRIAVLPIIDVPMYIAQQEGFSCMANAESR
jgi:ABC-type nitrate/sulfonate/bicarbonate transport system substrate-binding protein